LSAVTKVNPKWKTTVKRRLGQTSESREVTGTGDDYNWQRKMACPSFSNDSFGVGWEGIIWQRNYWIHNTEWAENVGSCSV